MLERCIPSEEESQHEKTSPSSFVVLRSRDVVAFLDILPMTGGEFFSAYLLPCLFPFEWDRDGYGKRKNENVWCKKELGGCWFINCLFD